MSKPIDVPSGCESYNPLFDQISPQQMHENEKKFGRGDGPSAALDQRLNTWRDSKFPKIQYF